MSRQNFTATGPSAPVIRPIETRYKGYRFRSRLEARWAVFFDALELRWEYEPEGYDLGFGQLYLPDFLVCDVYGGDMFVEVKGKEPTADEKRKLMTLCDLARRNGCFLIGTPGDGGDPATYLTDDGGCSLKGSTERWCEVLGYRYGKGYPMYSELEACDLLYWHGDGHGYRNHPRYFIEWGIARARAARFEHGECGV